MVFPGFSHSITIFLGFSYGVHHFPMVFPWFSYGPWVPPFPDFRHVAFRTEWRRLGHPICRLAIDRDGLRWQGKTMGKALENHGKMVKNIGKPKENCDLIRKPKENGDWRGNPWENQWENGGVIGFEGWFNLRSWYMACRKDHRDKGFSDENLHLVQGSSSTTCFMKTDVIWFYLQF